MKMMFCQECGELVVPSRHDMRPNRCYCGRHAVWWRNGPKGLISFNDKQKSDPREIPEGWEPRVWLIGVTNLFLQYPGETMTTTDITDIIEAHDDYYLFKRQKSCIIRVRPGHSSDSQWDHTPIGFGG